MLELTPDECAELERRVVERYKTELGQEFASRVSKITIRTIREYERMKREINTQNPSHLPNESVPTTTSQ